MGLRKAIFKLSILFVFNFLLNSEQNMARIYKLYKTALLKKFSFEYFCQNRAFQ